MESKKSLFSNHGIGVGLRSQHFARILDPSTRPSSVDWVEVISENFMAGPRLLNTGARRDLLRLREHLPVALHGVALSLGTAGELDPVYLRNLKSLVDDVQPIVVSDHLCWTRMGSRHFHDLNPIPYSVELARYLAGQILHVQEILGRRILIENVSTYLTFSSSEMTEEEFLSEIVRQADCGLLLDLNNVFVSATNHGFDPHRYLSALPHERVGQLHLAGHSDDDGFKIDTHDHPVCAEVWELYDWYGANYGHASAMIERDARIPPWEELEGELVELRRRFRPNTRVVTAPIQTRPAHRPDAGTLRVLEAFKTLQSKWTRSLTGDFELDGIESDSKRGSRERFEIYENAYWLRFQEVLADDFPDFIEAIGQEAFDELVVEIIREKPSLSYSINELTFRFLEGLRERGHPRLALAEADWARCLALYARASEPTGPVERDFSRLGSEAPEDFDRISLVFHPSAQFLPATRTAFWYDDGARERRFDGEAWSAIEALRSGLPLARWEGLPGLSPQNIQQWTQEGLIYGYQKNR